MKHDDKSDLPSRMFSDPAGIPSFSYTALARLQKAQVFACLATQRIWGEWRQSAKHAKVARGASSSQAGIGFAESKESESIVLMEQRLCALFAD